MQVKYEKLAIFCYYVTVSQKWYSMDTQLLCSTTS